MTANSRVVPEGIPLNFTAQSKNAPTVSQIINGTRCSPLTISEFEGFLKYSEHSVENLQFTVWYRSYCERFFALPQDVQAISPPPPERYRPYGGPNSMHASSMRTSSIVEKDKSWWKRLTLKPSSNTYDDEKEEGKGTGDWDADQGFVVEMEPTALVGHDPLVKLTQPVEGAKPVGSGNEAVTDTNKVAEVVDFGEAIHPRSLGPHVSVSPFPSRPNSVVKNGSPMLSSAPATPQIPDGRLPFNASIRPGLVRGDSHTSIASEADSDFPDRVTTRLTNLRFANLSLTQSRASKKSLEGAPLPFADEISLILTTFILPGSSRELNINARLRKHIIKLLIPVDSSGNRLPPRTTHPDVFKEAQESAYEMMENSLPKYLVYAKGNTNAPKTLFWWGIGMLDFLIGVMMALVILFRVHSRWWRIFSFLFIQFGTMQMYSASRYFCSQVHGRTSRQLYPWELTGMLEDDKQSLVSSGSAATFANAAQPATTNSTSLKASVASSLPFMFDEKAIASAGVRSKSKVTKKPWYGTWRTNDGSRVAVFGPERVVEDEYIKDIHNKQIKEILIVGAVVTFLLEVMFVALPQQHIY